jgi:hypothetical protein
VDVSTANEGRSGIVPTSSDTSTFVIWGAATNLQAWQSVATQTWAPAVGSWEYWLNSAGHPPNELDLGTLGDVSGATTRLFRHYLNNSGQPIFEFQDTGGTLHTLTTAVGVVDSSTHHLVYVLDGTNLTVYVDGAQAGQQAQGFTMKSPFTATVYLSQPAGGAGSRSYSGFLEHVGWYDQVLSAANVLALYRAGTVLP